MKVNQNISSESAADVPRLSVIVPVYNAEKYMTETLDSIVCQTFSDMEIILVDDVSTDGSAGICDACARKDSRVRVIHLEKNGGPGIARNAGIEQAKGEYITFVDADDLLTPDAFEKMYVFAAENNLDIVRCEVGVFRDDNPVPEFKFHEFGTHKIFRSRQELDEIAVCIFGTPVRPGQRNMNFGGSVWSALFHRSLFDNGGVRFPAVPHMISEDFIFCYDTARKARSFGIIPEMLFLYRLNPQSRTNIPSPDILQRAFATGEYIEEILLRDGYSEEYREFAYLFIIDITRAFIKNFFLSSMPFREKRRWFKSEKTCSPILDRAYRHFPMEYLPLKHRLNFRAFYKKRFYFLYALVRLRELLR